MRPSKGGGRSDAKILDFACQGGWIVVTLDAEFHALLALSGATGPICRSHAADRRSIAMRPWLTACRFCTHNALGSWQKLVFGKWSELKLEFCFVLRICKLSLLCDWC